MSKIITPALPRRVFLQQLGLGAAGISLLGALPAHAKSSRLPRSVPEAQGVNSRRILDFIDAVEARQMGMHSLMVLRHGTVVAEGWWAPYAADLRHTLYSLSKSYTSTAVGLAVAEGRLKVEDKVLSFFPGDAPAEVSANLAALQVKHLLMMGAGHGKDSLFGGDFKIENQNWVKSILARTVEFEPGTHFTYNNGATFLLSAIVQKVTGQNVFTYLTPRLFKPLGIEGADWEANPKDINDGAWGLRVKTEDIAKLGQLYLQKGVWNGKRILTEEWVEAATGVQIQNASGTDAAKNAASDWAQGYGYQFWRCRNGAYRGDGAYGQYCIVLPKEDAVIAITSEVADMQAVLNAVWDNLLPAVRGTSTANPRYQTQLKERMAGLKTPLPMGQRISPTTERVNRKTFAIADNSMGVKSVSLTFQRNSCNFTMQEGERTHRINCGFGQWEEGKTKVSPAPLHLVTTRPWDETRIAASAGWKDDNTLVMYWRFIETAHYESVTCSFEGDEVKVEFKKSTALLSPNGKDARPVLSGKMQG